MNIALVGASGFVGSHLSIALEKHNYYKFKQFRRGDSIKSLSEYEVVIHAANPAQRFKAEQDPRHDFTETVEKTSRIIQASGSARVVLISSISCRTQLDTVYGRNRRSCELLTLNSGGSIARLGPMYSQLRKKDVLHDILLGNDVYVSPSTRYAYVSAQWVAEEIVRRLDTLEDILELGAKDTIMLSDLAKAFNSTSRFTRDYIDDQYPLIPEPQFPSAALVYDFARQQIEQFSV